MADYLNLVFGNSPASDEYWLSFLIDLVEKKFKGVNQATLTTLVEERKKEHRRSCKAMDVIVEYHVSSILLLHVVDAFISGT